MDYIFFRSICNGLSPLLWSPPRQSDGFLLHCSSTWASIDNNMRAKTNLLYIIFHNNSLVIDLYLSIVNCVYVASNI